MRTVSNLVFLFLIAACAVTAFSQPAAPSAITGPTSIFTYQGRLSDGLAPANGNYQMQFGLFNAVSGGSQLGSTVTNNSVAVLNGVFTVQLDFGTSPFSTGVDCWIEIGVRKAADPPGFSTLSPRQQITSSPYSIRTLSAASADSLSAACVGCVADVQIAGLSGSKLTGSITTATIPGANVTGPVANATNAVNATTALNFSGPLNGDVTGTQSSTVVSTVGAVTAANVAAGANLANAATNLNTASTIVKRDASGNFAAGTITGNLAGNATTAGSATNFTGPLAGDVTGTQSATVVSTVGTVTAANVAAGANLANAATNLNTASTIVKRDASGNFAAGTITGNLAGNATTATTAGSSTNFTGPLAGDVTGTQSATVVSTVGAVTAANVAAGANLANAATNLNTSSTIVKRDGSGNFAAGTITGNLAGNATTATTATTATNATQLGGVGAAGYVLTSDSRLTDARTPTGAAGGVLSGTYPNPSLANSVVTASKIAALPGIRVLATVSQSFPNGGAFIAVNLDTVQYSSDATFNNAADEVTVHTSGIYMITSEVIWANNGSGARAMSITAAGTEVAFDASVAVPGTSSVSRATMILHLNAGDTVSLSGGQSSGGSLSTDATFGGRSAALSLQWMSP